MINQEHFIGQGIGNQVAHRLNWWYDLPKKYRHVDPFQVQGETTGAEDSVALIFVDPHTQSVRWAGHDFQEILRRQLMEIVSQPSPDIIIGSEYGRNLDSYITKENSRSGIPLGAKVWGSPSRFGSAAWDTVYFGERQSYFPFGSSPYIAQEQVVEQLERAGNQIETLQNNVDSLLDKVQALEGMLAESYKVLQALSQSYYWTSEWQAKETRAGEDDRLGRSQCYESVEALIADLNQ